MKVREIMTKNPACCTPDSSLQEVAQMMVEHDCGCIPVVDSHETKKPVGTITDRDITVRAFASGANPTNLKASDVMTSDVVSVRPGSSVEQCCDVMENKQIRRVLVVDESGKLNGIVAQADVAEFNTPRSGELVREISETTGSSGILGSNTQQRHNLMNASQPQRGMMKNFMQRDRREEQKMWGSQRGSKAEFLTGAILPLALGAGAAAAISFYLKQHEEPARRMPVRRTSTPLNTRNVDNLNTRNVDNPISSDFLAPNTTASTATSATSDTNFTSSTTATNRDEDTQTNMSFGKSAGTRQ